MDLARSDRVPGSLMLVGERGMGREGLAVELAAQLTCRTDASPGCGCNSCDRVRRGIHPDVVVLSPASKGQVIGIDPVRDELVERLDLLPFEGARRVFVLASLQTPPLTGEAASALLKAFEEPPAHVTIVGLAANQSRVLSTITSRAVQVRVPTPTGEELTAMVQACHRKLSREKAAAVVTDCGDDPAASLEENAATRGERLAALDGLFGELLDGDGTAGSEIAAMVGAGEDVLWLAVSALVTRAAGISDPEHQEFLLESGAALLAGERKRAALNLDPEGTLLGAIAPLLLEHSPQPR